MKYRKKPVVIDAFRWTGGPDQKEDPVWIREAIERGDILFCKGDVFFRKGDIFFRKGDRGIKMSILTLEGAMIANVGDYIIKGIKNEIYPCKADIFEATYEKVEE